jgi:hypothetical protein
MSVCHTLDNSAWVLGESLRILGERAVTSARSGLPRGVSSWPAHRRRYADHRSLRVELDQAKRAASTGRVTIKLLAQKVAVSNAYGHLTLKCFSVCLAHGLGCENGYVLADDRLQDCDFTSKDLPLRHPIASTNKTYAGNSAHYATERRLSYGWPALSNAKRQGIQCSFGGASSPRAQEMSFPRDVATTAIAQR